MNISTRQVLSTKNAAVLNLREYVLTQVLRVLSHNRNFAVSCDAVGLFYTVDASANNSGVAQRAALQFRSIWSPQ